MEKKRKNDLPTPTAESGGEPERKKTRRAKAEEADASAKEANGSEKQLQGFTGREGDNSEANVKLKMGLGTKRTKKPPKSLENFICRPTIRVSQKPGPAVGDGMRAKTKGSNQLRHPAQNKSSSDSLATKPSLSTTSTTENPSTQSPSSLTPSEKISPPSDSSNTKAAKKVLSRQNKKANSKPESTPVESPNVTQPQALMSVSHRKTPKKQTSPQISAPSSPPQLQQEPSTQEHSTEAENTLQHAASCESPSETRERSHKGKSAPPKRTSCLPKNDSKPSVNNTEMSSSVNLKLKRKERKSKSRSSNKSDSRTTGSNMLENDFLEKPSPCVSDQPENLPSAQVTDFPSLSKCTDNTAENSSRVSEGQNEQEGLGKSLKMTMKSSQSVPVLEQQKRGRTEPGLPEDEHGERLKHCPDQEQIEAHSLSDTEISAAQGSIVNPKISPTSANPSISGSSSNKKKSKKTLKKEKRKHLHCSKIAKMTTENFQKPAACTSVLQGSSPQKDYLKAPPSPSQQRISPKLKQPMTVTVTSEMSSANKPQARKRGRPKVNKLERLLLPESSANSTNIPTQDPDQEPDRKHQRSTTAGKRGRPKRSFSVQPQSTQPAVTSKQSLKDTGDHQMTSKEKVKDTQQKCSRSSKVMMKTIIRKINKMKVKRKDQVLTQILLGQKQCDNAELPQEDSGAELCSRVSPDKQSLSSLVTSFGGKLGPQINVSKRGTIYMGKRRGRKPKCERNSSSLDPKQILPSPLHSQQQFNSNTMRQSSDSQTGTSSLKNDSSSATPGRISHVNPNNQKVKAASFLPLSEFQNPKTHCKTTFASNSGGGVNDTNTLDRNARHSNSGLSASTGLPSTLAAGSHMLFTVSGVQGSGSLKAKSKSLSHFPSEKNQHLSSTRLPLGSGRMQDSNGVQIANPTLGFPNQEAHTFKCHRRGHHCLVRDKLRRHTYKCKKYMQLRAKRQDPDFLAEVEDLVVRLSKIQIVHHISARARLEEDGSVSGRKSAKGKSQSHDLQCLQEEVHPPTMFQINFSGYYSPHSTLSGDPLHYVRMANMKRKHGCSSEPNEQIVTHFPVMHKLGYPVSGCGFFHPSYKVPFTTASLGFGLYRGYPSTMPLYPSSFPSSYVHHYSKNPIISPSKFHKKKTKVPKQDSGGLWGGKSIGAYPRMTPDFSCDCFTRQSCQREKPKDKIRGEGDEQSRTRGREKDIEWLLRQNKLSKDNERSRTDCPSKPALPFSVFSNVRSKDKTFPSNLRPTREVRWSEHQPPWPRMRDFESKLGSRNRNQEFTSHEQEDTLEEPESEGELATPQQPSRRTQSFLKQPILFSNTQRQRRVRKRNGVTSASMLFREQDATSLEDFSSLAEQRAGYVQTDTPQLSNSPTAKEPENTERELRGHKAIRRPLLQDDGDRAPVQSLAHFMQEHPQPHFKQPRNTARAKLTQRIRSSTARNPGGLKLSAGNEVKKRGRGRPRKNPPTSPCRPDSSPPPLIPAPPRPPPHLEQVEKAGTAGGAKSRGDSMLEVIEAVIHREQRKRVKKKRRSAEDEGDEGQKGREGEDGTETPNHHSPPPLTAPSPDHTAPDDIEADSQSDETSASLPIKKYLWAGLYSDVYKTEDVVELEPLSTECLEYDPEEHEHGLLPAPLHVGKYLRLKRIDFQLPYDIHWLCAHSKNFETTGNLPPALTCNDSCRAAKDSTPQHCTEDSPHIRLPDSSKQADVLQLQEEDEPCLQPLQQQEEIRDSEDFPSPLSSEERTFVMSHGVFLVRNYEKMRARQALLLLREGVGEREEEDEGTGEETSYRCLSDQRSSPEEEKQTGGRSRTLKHTLQEIWNRIISCKGSSGQTLTAPLLNLCSRKRSDSALLDLTVVKKQLHSGHYDSLEAFHTDMLRVFQCAEKYYGCDSSVGRDVSQLRVLYNQVHQEVSVHTSHTQ
ncbi:histone-lysine N-methyltransferase ASH1L isoform X1 [Astyanax mexicanus]|uniref:ASH1 like histone lysine methyltransferase n=1 Tax=Astyanax mexicanus TaxID=7994 RepID=A0A8B9KDG1_ASTMX|nr:histone-lysine N-methyltransferase ASH1L isoform X1 [Astyanax mexicanus]